jgi:hypothetical protein
MKNYLIIACLLILGISSFSQTEKGNILVGTDILNIIKGISNKEDFGFEINPNMGIFLIDNLTIGVSPIISYTHITKINVTKLGVGPFLRYYYIPKKVGFFIHGGYMYSKSFSNDVSFEKAYHGIQFGPGMCYFVYEYIGIEGLFGYYYEYVDNLNTSNIILSLRLQIYLSKLDK